MEGNQMKMREALLKLRAEIGRFYNNEWIPYDDWEECDDMISHALSEPARQCDVGTPEEQEKRYKLKREVYHTLTLTNALAWEQTPYEAQEGCAGEREAKQLHVRPAARADGDGRVLRAVPRAATMQRPRQEHNADSRKALAEAIAERKKQKKEADDDD